MFPKGDGTLSSWTLEGYVVGAWSSLSSDIPALPHSPYFPPFPFSARNNSSNMLPPNSWLDSQLLNINLQRLLVGRFKGKDSMPQRLRWSVVEVSSYKGKDLIENSGIFIENAKKKGNIYGTRK